jgi:hypothetical protein
MRRQAISKIKKSLTFSSHFADKAIESFWTANATTHHLDQRVL